MSTENMRKLMMLAESLDEDYRDDPNRPGWQDEEGNWHSYEDETCPHCQGWGEYIDPEGFDEPVHCPHCDEDDEPIRKSRLVKDMAMDMDMDWTDLGLADVDPADLKGFPKVEESEERPYLCVHAKKGKHECKATSSYGAAKKAAEHWGLKSTAGIDAHLTDIEHSTQFVGESFTRKHFQMVADTLQKIEDPEVRRAQAEEYVQQFAAANPRFRRDLFMKAAGVEELEEGPEFIDDKLRSGEIDADDVDYDWEEAGTDGKRIDYPVGSESWEEKVRELAKSLDIDNKERELYNRVADDEMNALLQGELEEASCPCGKDGCECGPDCDCEPVEESANDDWGVGDYVVPAWETPGEDKEPAKVIAVVGDQVKVKDDFGNVHLMFPEDLIKAPVEEDRKKRERPEVKGINDKYDDELKCKHCGDYFCTSKFGGDCPEIQMDMFGEIELDEIVESILNERGQPKDYEMSDEELAAEIEDETSEFERDHIDKEIEDEELGLRFD